MIDHPQTAPQAGETPTLADRMRERAKTEGVVMSTNTPRETLEALVRCATERLLTPAPCDFEGSRLLPTCREDASPFGICDACLAKRTVAALEDALAALPPAAPGETDDAKARTLKAIRHALAQDEPDYESSPEYRAGETAAFTFVYRGAGHGHATHPRCAGRPRR